jgi:hypothetical protein
LLIVIAKCTALPAALLSQSTGRSMTGGIASSAEGQTGALRGEMTVTLAAVGLPCHYPGLRLRMIEILSSIVFPYLQTIPMMTDMGTTMMGLKDITGVALPGIQAKAMAEMEGHMRADPTGMYDTCCSSWP